MPLSDRSPIRDKRGIAAASAQAVIAAFFVLFFLYPLFLALKGGFYDAQKGFTFFWFANILQNETHRGELFNSFILALTTTVLVTIISIPLASINVNYKFRGQNFLTALLLLPLILPPFVGALSVQRFLSQFGILNLLLERLGWIELAQAPDWLGQGFWISAVLQALHLFPVMYLNLVATFANLDPALSEAGMNLGANRMRTFRHITLPLLRPGLFSGGSIVFIGAFTDIGTPLMVGYEKLTAVRIFRELSSADISPRTYSLVLVLLFCTVLLFILGKVIFGNTERSETNKASIAKSSSRLSKVGTLAAWCFFLLIIILAGLPHLGVIITAFAERWYTTVLPETYTFAHMKLVLTEPAIKNTIFNSLRYAGLSTLIDLILGSIAAWLIIRSRPMGHRLLDGLIMLPLAVPGVILASGFVAMTPKGSCFESIGPMRNPLIIIVIAYSIRRMPFVVRGVAAGLQQIPIALEEAAHNLGSTRLSGFFRVTLPLIMGNILAAGVLTFSLAMLEVSDSLVLAQLQADYPITKEIYAQAMSANLDSHNIAAALGVYGMMFLGGSLALASLLLGKRLGAIFRM